MSNGNGGDIGMVALGVFAFWLVWRFARKDRDRNLTEVERKPGSRAYLYQKAPGTPATARLKTASLNG